MEMSPNILKILQGIPGEDRSSFIRRQTASRVWPMYAMVCSENQYTKEVIAAVNPLIQATLSPTSLCFRRATKLLMGNAPFIIIDNTNQSVADVAPYVCLAEAYGYAYEVIFVDVAQHNETDRRIHSTITQGDWPVGWNRSVVVPG